MNKICVALLTVVIALYLLGCSEETPVDLEPPRDITAEVQAYYKAHPDFFLFKTPGDIPADLIWDDGLQYPEFGSENAIKGGTLRLAMLDFPRTLRYVGPDSNTGMRKPLYDNNAMALVSLHPNLQEYIPALAKQWAVAKDGCTLYFKLDPEARFSDGHAVTANDFLFTFFFMRSSYIQAPWYNNFYTEKFTNITKYDNYTISITLAEGDPDPLAWAAIPPTPEHFYKEFGPDFCERYQWVFPPTTGAYEVVPEYIKKGQSITQSRVKNWWAREKRYYRQCYNVDKIRYQVIRDETKAFECFLKNEIDMYALTLPEYWYKKSNTQEFKKGYICKSTFYNQIPRPPYGIYVNCDKPLLNDIHIREGLQYSMNFDHVIASYFRGDYGRLKSFTEGYGSFTNQDIPERPFDPQKAAQSFTKAGFTKRGPDGILINAQGQRLSFTLTTGYPQLNNIFPILKEEAKKAGVEITIEQLDPLTAYKKAMQKEHELIFCIWGAGYSRYPTCFWEMFHSENAHIANTNNLTNTDNTELSRLIDMYERTASEPELQALCFAIQKKIWDEACFIPGFYCPWFRVGYWRWIRFPEGFNVKLADDAVGMGLFWIDEEIKKDVLQAKKQGRDMETRTKTYDQFK